MDAVRTPLDHGTALALGNKRYRKQVLKVGDVHYQGGKFPVTPAYLDSVVKAFDAKAITKVPFQLADAGNRHTEDPLRRFGTVVGLHRTPDGLDAVLELDDEAARLVDKDPDFGVSVLIKHDRTTGEGQHYDAVLAHVLGTTDPVLTSLKPWCPELAASHPVEDTLDLLALTSAPHDADEPTKEKPMADAVTLTPEELAQLRSLLAKADTPPVDAVTDTVDDEPAEREFSDDELKEMAEALDDEPAELVEEPELIAASNDNDEVLALSQRLAETEQAREDDRLALAQLRDERDEARYLSQRDEWAHKYGVHPTVTDIVKPLLKQAGQTLALANGDELDPAALIGKFVHEIATRPRLDLSQAKGSALDLDGDESEAKERAELAALAVKSLS